MQKKKLMLIGSILQIIGFILTILIIYDINTQISGFRYPNYEGWRNFLIIGLILMISGFAMLYSSIKIRE